MVLSMLVLVIGGVLYLALTTAKDPHVQRASELGKVMFLCGLLAWLLAVGGKAAW